MRLYYVISGLFHVFFSWLKEAKPALPTSLSELDARLGDYLNYLYQDELPLNWGSDTVSGFKRFYPACRRHLETSHMYYRDWCKTIVRIRAFPLSADLVKGMAAVVYTEQQPKVGAAFLFLFRLAPCR